MTVKIHGKDYKTVAERVAEIHKATKGMVTITTEIISNDEIEVIMKATIQVEDQYFTGHALERYGSTMFKYFLDSFVLIFSATPVMVTCRSRATQLKSTATLGLSVIWPAFLLL